MLVGFGTLSCRVEGLAARGPERPQLSPWVRTADGWERTDSWHEERLSPPAVHPLVVAAGQGLLSVLALVAWQRDGGRAGRKC